MQMYPKKIDQLRNILDTAQLTLSQVYESEFDTQNRSNSFGNVLNRTKALICLLKNSDAADDSTRFNLWCLRVDKKKK